MIKIYNTLRNNKEEFSPIKDKTVAMYVCGVTPYDEVHLGHARAYVTFDIVRRHLEHSGYSVRYIQNFTDVDDKIIKRAQERSISPLALAQTYIDDYFTQMDKLNIKRADAYPRVTQSIPQIIDFVNTIVKKNKAYVIGNGDVYFSIEKFPGYGKLSKRNIDELQSGARVEIDTQKKNPLDFALWKSSKPGEPEEVSWDSPWGKGRPGWHIECSVMSINALGPTIDIHGGGQDLIFPHHENEIAQSEAATGVQFVKYWMHNGFVTINHEKMSKSLGNFFTLREIFEKYPPRVVRYFLLSQHYRSPLDFSDDKLQQAQNALAGIDEAYQKLNTLPAIEDNETLRDILSEFIEALNDDFNTEKALAVVHVLKRDAVAELSKEHDPVVLRKATTTLKVMMEDFLGIPLLKEETPAEVLALLKQREDARKEKDWAASDALRKKIDEMGYKIEDRPGKPSTLIKKTV
jgi:cysteinyl-tRNA synthetase